MKKYKAIKIGVTAILIMIVLSINSAVNADVSCKGKSYDEFEADVTNWCSKNIDAIRNYYNLKLDSTWNQLDNL